MKIDCNLNGCMLQNLLETTACMHIQESAIYSIDRHVIVVHSVCTMYIS